MRKKGWGEGPQERGGREKGEKETREGGGGKAGGREEGGTEGGRERDLIASASLGEGDGRVEVRRQGLVERRRLVFVSEEDRPALARRLGNVVLLVCVCVRVCVCEGAVPWELRILTAAGVSLG